MTIDNLSFETEGATPGFAADWTWTRVAPFSFQAIARPDGGISRFEGFEFGWGCDDFVDALVVPTNATPFVFADGATDDAFEIGWRAPNSHGLAPSGLGPWFGASPPFAGYPYGLTAPFVLSNGETLNFVITDAQGVATSVACTFTTGEFANIAAAKAVEVVNAINHAIGVAYAGSPAAGFAFADAFGHVFIRTIETGGAHLVTTDPSFESSAGTSIQIVSGTAIAALGYVVGTFHGGVDAQHPGNETAVFEFDGGALGLFNNTTLAFEGFEVGWANVPYFVTFAEVSSAAAIFADDSNPFENFESGWHDNEAYFFTWAATTHSAADFLIPPSGFNPFENFEYPKFDQTVSPDYTGPLFNCTAHGFSNGDSVTLYAGVAPNGAAGAIPTGINPLLTYYVVGATSNTFQVSITFGGSAVAFTDNGVAPCFVKANPVFYWTTSPGV